MITMDRKFQTRKDSLPVEILRNNVKNPDFPIVGIITFADGSQQQDRWTANGYYYSAEQGQHLRTSDLDLVPVPEPKPVTHWMWVVMKVGSDEIKYSGYCKQEVEYHCDVSQHEVVRMIQWNTWEFES